MRSDIYDDDEDDILLKEAKRQKKQITVSMLRPGCSFSVDGVSYKLLKLGPMGAYVQLLKGAHIITEEGKEFDRPGCKMSISGGSVVD